MPNDNRAKQKLLAEIASSFIKAMNPATLRNPAKNQGRSLPTKVYSEDSPA